MVLKSCNFDMPGRRYKRLKSYALFAGLPAKFFRMAPKYLQVRSYSTSKLMCLAIFGVIYSKEICIFLLHTVKSAIISLKYIIKVAIQSNNIQIDP